MFQKNLIRLAGIGAFAIALSSGALLTNAATPTYQPSKGQPIHFNWGKSGPPKFPKDHFTARFDQSKSYNSGDHFIQTLADDGVKVEADGKTLINRWSDSGETSTVPYGLV